MAILTVSRLYGSGGSEVAAIVARTLGWSLLDNAVVDAVAARMGLSVAEVQARVDTHIQIHRLQQALQNQNTRLEETVASRTHELAERVCAAYGCPHHPHLVSPPPAPATKSTTTAPGTKRTAKKAA